MDGCKSHARDKEYADDGSGSLEPVGCGACVGEVLLLEVVPSSIHVYGFCGVSVAAATFGIHHQAVGLAIVVVVDDVAYFLFGICLWMVEHFQQLAEVMVCRHCRFGFNV